jgi:CRISPR/Cas system-associated exonuclease Cas4 (RecB family)
MSLNPEFRFSQNNLQDYIDCPRRFELRYILRQEWPALLSEPVIEQEQRMDAGKQFHLMVQQLVIGLQPELLLENASQPDLTRWWDNFTTSQPLADLPSQRFAEYFLSAQLASFRLTAQLDLLAIEPGQKAFILDWKTSAHKPSRIYLKKRLQTQVYPFLLVEAGTFLNGNRPVAPEQVEMIYWFAEAPTEPERFTYTPKQYSEDRAYLEALIQEISEREKDHFTLTPDVKKCLYCNYRSLCNRGERAGSSLDLEDELEEPETPAQDLGFEQIGEIEF